ncbi:MAG: trimethylamine methyltransferase family protein [Anaerolineae bacterium]|nr:trimethylamine methyltransferase family protein [Anaerolineae bacterium]
MKAARFDVLSAPEIEHIHAASMAILAEVGIKVDYARARELFRQAGAQVDDDAGVVRLPEAVLLRALETAPATFTLYGNDPDFRLDVGGDTVCFAGLGTPTHILDTETGERREATMADVREHIQIISALDHIHNSQMDVWPADVPMTTIHGEAILAWAQHSRKSFGMGCYGFLPTLDMMRMMAIAAGGKEALRARPRFFAICSIGSPLQMITMQIEGLLICAEYGQPLAMSPEAIAGSTAPATLAGLLAQQNANILAHVALAQIARPGTPVLYSTVSTITNMRLGTVALGAVETGLITAASAQLARRYGLPCRSVGAATEAKVEDVQAGIERTATLLQAVLAGVNFITCGGTLDATMLESHPLLVLDDELCGMALRMAEGIRVDEETLALDVIRKVNYSGHYLAEKHTMRHFRTEHYMPALLVREGYETWEKEGRKNAIDRARERVRAILAAHRPNDLDPAVERELVAYLDVLRARKMEEFLKYEDPAQQDFETL